MEILPEPAMGDIREYLGRRTIITGDVNSGKTWMTERFLRAVLDVTPSRRVAVIDLAPLVPAELAAARGLAGIGGRLTVPEDPELLVLRTRIDPPRLLGVDDDGVRFLARCNLIRSRELFRAWAGSGRDVLLINDMSMFLQAGPAGELMGFLEKAQTLIANGYKGRKLGADVFSLNERREMETVLSWCGRVIELGGA